ncbi:uncharacterized protein LOC121669129 isoform X3 [Corvus kubaryi]|uniref:uncharacterized protein LOC121669129 isoform X3 n=1 Tax=Corvus kubaryi TaxID=68294 RepID=UPI001C040A61|nr:uncharacterized protein LOC121669129 isoform X3 [Corvus kubaryi]
MTMAKRTLKRKQVIPVSRGNIQCKYINVADENKKKSICTTAKNKGSLLAKKWLSELEKDMNALMDPGGSHPSSSVLMWDADGQMGINACLETNG